MFSPIYVRDILLINEELESRLEEDTMARAAEMQFRLESQKAMKELSDDEHNEPSGESNARSND